MRFLLDRLFIKKPRFRRLVTRIIYGNRDVSVDLCGCPLIINTLTENGYFRASRFIRRSSLLADEIPVLLSLASLVGQSDGFVDIGANVGVFSSVMAQIAKLHSKRYSVYAF